jgi:hypothetical protein
VVVGIHQLHYLPWLRYFHKIACSEIFVVLDNIQYNKNGYQNRNRIKSPRGPLMLTVPVYDHFGQSLDSVQIDNKRNWAAKHWRSIEQNYRRAPYYESYAPGLSAFYQRPWESLNALNRAMLPWFLASLEITTPLLYSSEIDAPGEATTRLIQLIRAAGGTAYLTGAYALDAYLDADELAAAGIALEIQSWKSVAYPQAHGPFVSDLSILDLLMHCGPQSRRVLLGQPIDTP